jgi:2-polyprenyl-3-methyl-5-hydroxy-6-metoxy-1,4-benzoquinol methylase
MQGQNGIAASRDFVWQLLTNARAPGQDGYFEHVRRELLDLFVRPPRHLLDIGCGTGLTGLEARQRFPDAVVDGVEYSRTAAAVAAERLHRVHQGDVGEMDFGALGYAAGSIDGLLLADVLEHLYNPWDLLVRIRPYLAPDAQIVASIPNARNLILLNELAGGNFSYEPAGLLDVTHIRFFTRREILKLFAETGYDVLDMRGSLDPRIPPMAPIEGAVNLDMPFVSIKNVNTETLNELTTIQFFVIATPHRG